MREEKKVGDSLISQNGIFEDFFPILCTDIQITNLVTIHTQYVSQ